MSQLSMVFTQRAQHLSQTSAVQTDGRGCCMQHNDSTQMRALAQHRNPSCEAQLGVLCAETHLWAAKSVLKLGAQAQIALRLV